MPCESLLEFLMDLALKSFQDCRLDLVVSLSFSETLFPSNQLSNNLLGYNIL